MLNSRIAQPQSLYVHLLGLAGAWSALDPLAGVPAFAPLDFVELQRGYDAVLQWLETTLELIRAGYRSLPFERSEQSFSIQLPDEQPSQRLVIGLRMPNGASEQAAIDWLRGAIIASAPHIALLSRQRMSGLSHQAMSRSEQVAYSVGEDTRLFVVTAEGTWFDAQLPLMIAAPAAKLDQQPVASGAVCRPEQRKCLITQGTPYVARKCRAGHGLQDAPLSSAFRQTWQQWQQEWVQLPKDSEDEAALVETVVELSTQASQRLWRTAYSRVGDSATDQVKALVYAFVALVDETLLFTPWPGQAAWQGKPLESRLYSSRQAGEQVPAAIQTLLDEQQPTTRDLANVYLQCLILGFHGRLRGEHSQAQMAKWRLALFNFAWQDEARLRRCQPASGAALAGHAAAIAGAHGVAGWLSAGAGYSGNVAVADRARAVVMAGHRPGAGAGTAKQRRIECAGARLMSPLTIVAWVVALLLLLAIIAVAVWWLRTQSGAAIRSFYASVRHMEREQGNLRIAIRLPWLLMLGDEIQGTQLVTEWRLQPTDKPAWFGRWWSDPEGAVLVVPQALFLPDDGMNLQRGSWWRLLGLILRLRSKRPLDGVIWTVPVNRLSNLEQAAQLGVAARRRFIDLLQRFGLSVPVYVVVSGLEELPGFQDLISALPQEAREATLGWSSPYPRDALWQGQWSDQAVDRLHRAVAEAVIEIGTLSGQLSADLYALPDRLETLRRGLQNVLEPVFQGNAQGEAPCFRGVYFTANVAGEDAQDGFSVDDSGLQRSAFVRQLWRQRLVGERGLAHGVPRLLRLRQRWQRLTAGVALVVGVVWAVAMLWVWQARSRMPMNWRGRCRARRRATWQSVMRRSGWTRPGATCRPSGEYWKRAPHWNYVSLVFPTSWFSSLDNQLEQQVLQSTERHMVVPLHDLLSAELAQLKAIRSTDRRSSVESDDPAQWQNYLKANDLVDRALRLEQQNQWFNQAAKQPARTAGRLGATEQQRAVA